MFDWDVKHWFVLVSQQLVPLVGIGQLSWHCWFVVHEETQT